MNQETWLPVPYQPFDRAYSVSNYGRVKPNKPSRYSKNGAAILKPLPSPGGYLHVSLYAEGKRRTANVHTMVALAFVGPKPFEGAEVCHKDDQKMHNHADNLEWGTGKSNAATREAIGKTTRGVGNGRSILSEEQVHELRALYAEGGITQMQLAERFGVAQTIVSKVVLRKSWRHVS